MNIRFVRYLTRFQTHDLQQRTVYAKPLVKVIGHIFITQIYLISVRRIHAIVSFN